MRIKVVSIMTIIFIALTFTMSSESVDVFIADQNPPDPTPTEHPPFGVGTRSGIRTIGNKYIYIKAGAVGEIRTAINRANQDQAYTYILLIPQGTYLAPTPVYPQTSSFHIQGTVILQGVTPDYALPGEVTLERSTTPPLNQSFRLFFIEPTGSLTIRNLKLLRSGGSSIGFGGTIYNYGALHLINSKILEGVSTTQGGGVYNINPGITKITNVLFRDNTANVGGAIANFSGVVDVDNYGSGVPRQG